MTTTDVYVFVLFCVACRIIGQFLCDVIRANEATTCNLLLAVEGIFMTSLEFLELPEEL